MGKKKIDDGYSRNLFLYRLLRPLLLVVAKIIFNPKIIGKENVPKKDGCIIACNHIHAIDPAILIYSTRRVVHFIAKKELFKGFMKYFYLSFGTIPVDRDKRNPLAVNLAEEYLSDNEIIGIFPEGTRNKSKDKLLPFRYGAVRMAKETSKVVVPCAISGNYKLFSRVIIKFGRAIDVSNMEIDDANNLLREKVLELLEDK